MLTPDAINAMFELGGAALLTLNIRRLFKDRTVAGVSVWPTAFFSAWGLWNLAFYIAVNAPLSWWAGLFLCAVNFVWLAGVFGLTMEREYRLMKLREELALRRSEESQTVVANQPDQEPPLLDEELLLMDEAPPTCVYVSKARYDTVSDIRATAARRLAWREAKQKSRRRAKLRKKFQEKMKGKTCR